MIDSKKNEVNLQYLSLFKNLNNLLKEVFLEGFFVFIITEILIKRNVEGESLAKS